MNIIPIIIATAVHFGACILIGIGLAGITSNSQWTYWAGGYAIMTSLGGIAGAYWKVYITMVHPKTKRRPVFSPAMQIVIAHAILVPTMYYGAEGTLDLRIALFALPAVPFVVHIARKKRSILDRRRKESEEYAQSSPGTYSSKATDGLTGNAQE